MGTTYRYYDPNTKTYGDKYTWGELLYSFYKGVKAGRKSYWGPIPTENHLDYYAVNRYFSGFGHTDKDGEWEEPTRNHWRIKYITTAERVPKAEGIRPRDLLKNSTLKVTQVEVKEPKKWVLKTRIVDSSGAVLSAGYLKDSYKKYIPNLDDEKKSKPRIYTTAKWLYSNDFIIRGYTFRSGPIPGINGHWRRGRGWARYRGDHGSVIHELRYREGYEQEQRDTAYEYGTTFKMSRRTVHQLDEYHYHNRKTKGHGWKVTRVEKQWMRGLGRSKPLSVQKESSC